MTALATGVVELRVSTIGMPVDQWREEFARGFLHLDIEPQDAAHFRAEAIIRALPGLTVASCFISASHWRRSPAFIAPGTDSFGLMFGLHGPEALVQRGRTLELGSGDAGTCSHTEPADLTLHGNAGRHVGLVLPLKALADMVPNLEASMPTLIPQGSDALRLLIVYLDALVDRATLASPDLCRTAVAHVHDLIALAIGAGRDGTELAAGRGLRAARLRAAKADILKNLASQQLSVAAVAQRQGVSPRYLHMLFEADGTTFSQFVLERRLTLARRLLADHRFDGRTITDIAYEAGFGDLSYFHRVFRKRFAMTPGDARREPGGEGTG